MLALGASCVSDAFSDAGVPSCPGFKIHRSLPFSFEFCLVTSVAVLVNPPPAEKVSSFAVLFGSIAEPFPLLTWTVWRTKPPGRRTFEPGSGSSFFFLRSFFRAPPGVWGFVFFFFPRWCFQWPLGFGSGAPCCPSGRRQSGASFAPFSVYSDAL